MKHRNNGDTSASHSVSPPHPFDGHLQIDAVLRKKNNLKIIITIDRNCGEDHVHDDESYFSIRTNGKSARAVDARARACDQIHVVIEAVEKNAH